MQRRKFSLSGLNYLFVTVVANTIGWSSVDQTLEYHVKSYVKFATPMQMLRCELEWMEMGT